MLSKGKATILLVDDNPDMVTTMSCILFRSGYNVVTAADGLEAVERFRVGRFDLVLMDMVMPLMDGLEAFHKIRQIDPAASVILMTAYYDESRICSAVAAGAICSVHKPVDIPGLIRLIKKSICEPAILIVDDNSEFCDSMSRVFARNGLKVAVAGSGEEALTMARQTKFRIAFVDLRLPHMDGVETYMKLKDLDPALAGIMMTGYGDDYAGRLRMAEVAGKASCLFKPFDPAKAVSLAARSGNADVPELA